MSSRLLALETDRLRLRPLTAEDAAFILELVNEPAWWRFIGDRGVRTLEDARAYILAGPVAMYARHGFGLLAVELKHGSAPIGICGLIKRDTLPDVDLGFALLERHWGEGYAHEAAAAVLAHGDGALKLARIVALTSPENERSGRLLAKLGFRPDGMVRVTEDKPECRLWVRAKPAGAAV